MMIEKNQRVRCKLCEGGGQVERVEEVSDGAGEWSFNVIHVRLDSGEVCSIGEGIFNDVFSAVDCSKDLEHDTP